jgi:hypothetical protein
MFGYIFYNKKTNYMLMSHHQKSGQKQDIKIVNMSFEGVAKLKYSGLQGTTQTDQNCMHKEIKNRLNLGNACYHSVQSHLSFSLLCRNLKFKICKTMILPFVLFVCETWSFTLRE